MKRIVFATNNQHKLQEIRDILGSDYEVVSLKEIGCDVDIPETGNTLEENALQKAQYVYDHYHVSCFADDTGLEVEALDGAPGVHSARYAEGTDHDSEANMAKLLRELDGKENRQARFRTVICYIEKQDVCPCGCTSIKKIHQFEGIVNGYIAPRSMVPKASATTQSSFRKNMTRVLLSWVRKSRTASATEPEPWLNW